MWCGFLQMSGFNYFINIFSFFHFDLLMWMETWWLVLQYLYCGGYTVKYKKQNCILKWAKQLTGGSWAIDNTRSCQRPPICLSEFCLFVCLFVREATVSSDHLLTGTYSSLINIHAFEDMGCSLHKSGGTIHCYTVWKINWHAISKVCKCKYIFT